MYELKIPSNVLCWTFLSNEDFIDKSDIKNRVIDLIIKGIIDFSKQPSKRVIKSSKPLVIWLAQYIDKFSHKNDYKSLEGDKVWAILFSNFEDGDEAYLFAPLIKELSLKIYDTLYCSGFYDIMHFQPELISVIEPNGIIIQKNLGLKEETICCQCKKVKFDDINIVLPSIATSIFPEADETINSLFSCNLIFDVFETNIIWENLIITFIKGINGLCGSPSYKQLVSILNSYGINVKRDNINQLGLTAVEIYDRIVFPEITIKATLNDSFAKIVLEHEIGHLIMHLPILIASKLECYFPSVITSYSPSINDKIFRETCILEMEADWIGALLLCPPLILSYLETMGFPRRTGKKIKIVIATREGNAIREPEQFLVWYHLRRSVFGQGEQSWDERFDDIELFSNIRHDQNGYLIADEENDLSINNLLIRYTNMVLYRNRILPYYEDRDPASQKLIKNAFKIIVQYLGRFEKE